MLVRGHEAEPSLEELAMRFMMLMIPKGYERAAPGTVPDAKAVAAMMKYNESLQKAGILLALARISGETAPLLFTALSNQFWTSNLNEPMASLPVTIFKFAMSPYENWQKLAWAGVFIITIGVLVLNILARVLFRNKH